MSNTDNNLPIGLPGLEKTNNCDSDTDHEFAPTTGDRLDSDSDDESDANKPKCWFVARLRGGGIDSNSESDDDSAAGGTGNKPSSRSAGLVLW